MPALFLDQSYSSVSGRLPDRSDFDAEEPDLVESDAAAGRAAVAARSGIAPLVKMLGSKLTAVLSAAAEALFNLAIMRDNADALHGLGALRTLHDLLGHDEIDVVSGFTGVLMNCCASSPAAREELVAQGLLPTLFSLLVRAAGEIGDPLAEPELAARTLGALNNLLLDQRCAASALGHEKSVLLVLRLLAEPQGNDDALLEDAASCLLRVARASDEAALLLLKHGLLPIVEARLTTELEELQLRLCQLVQKLCATKPAACEEFHALGGTSKLLPLLSSSSEEVQEGAALALQQLTCFRPAATACRREGGIEGLVALFRSTDLSVQTAAVACLVNISRADQKAAAATREAEGLAPLVAFLSHSSEELRVAAAFCVEGVARNESNKALLREAGAIEALLRMLSHTCSAEEQTAAVGACVNLVENEEEAATLFRLQGGIKRLRPILAMADVLRPALAAAVLSHCAATNSETKVAMRVCDVLRPLVELLSSQTRAARLNAAGALIHATNGEPTNQIKVRECGAVMPLTSLLEEEAAAADGGEVQMQSRAAWCLANLAGDPVAACQLGTCRAGYEPLIKLLGGANVNLQRPAAACLLNASINDAAAGAGLVQAGALGALVDCLAYAAEDAHPDVVAWAAGALLNISFAPSGLCFDRVGEGGAKLLSALLACLSTAPGADALQNANAAGAIGNLAAHSEACRRALVGKGAVRLLLELLGAARDEPAVARHAAGALASLLTIEEGRAALADEGGVAALVEALESDDATATAAAAVALLNQMSHEPSREALVDAGGVPALLGCLSSRAAAVREAAAGALLNASAAQSAAEAVRDGLDRDGQPSSLAAFALLGELLGSVEAGPLLRGRVAGTLFNCAAYGPDNRLALLEAGVVLGAVALLHELTSEASDAKGVPVWLRALGADASPAQRWRLTANTVGIVLNCALNPSTKKEVLRGDGLAPLLLATASGDAPVMALAATAIAYVSDRAEHRPGSPTSNARAADGAPRNTFRKRHFHTGGAAAAFGPADDEADEAPGARPTAVYGRMPETKLYATHDSSSKGPRFVAEPLEPYARRTEAAALPIALSPDYVEIPSPLPSPRGE